MATNIKSFDDYEKNGKTYIGSFPVFVSEVICDTNISEQGIEFDLSLISEEGTITTTSTTTTSTTTTSTTSTTSTSTTPPPECLNCDCCITPSSDDPSTVEYYGYASDPSWCNCVGVGSICGAEQVITSEGSKIGYHCIPDVPPSEIQCLNYSRNIFPSTGCPIQIPCPSGCGTFNFLAQKTFVNPFNSQAYVYITGSVDDDAFLTRENGFHLWFRSNDPDNPACEAGEINYNFTVGPNETFTLAAYDTVGIFGLADICAEFSLTPIT